MVNCAHVIGIHPIAVDEPVHLIELEIEGSLDDFDFGKVTQMLPGQPQSNWQVAYDEREVCSELGRVRFAFFFHDLDPRRPLLSPGGPLALPPESPVPEYLKGVVYDPP